jgi:hypothetical protein
MSSSEPCSPPKERWPEHDVSAEVLDLIRRCHWQSAKSTEDVAPHQYVVLNWSRDDVTEGQFWDLVSIIKTHGRLEEWTPPAEWVRRWGGRPMVNSYLYVDIGDGLFAYWFTNPRNRTPMLNRERVAQQERTPTRRVIGEPARN